MSLRRGDLVTVAAKGAYTGKPRPALVIQAARAVYLVTSDKAGLLALKKHGITRILAPKALLKPLD